MSDIAVNEICAQASVPQNHPSLAGHFPGQPIVPGVVLLDLVLDAIQAQWAGPLMLTAIVSTKFLQAVAPDTQLEMRIKLTRDEQPSRLKARFTTTHAGASVLEGSFMLDIPERTT